MHVSKAIAGFCLTSLFAATFPIGCGPSTAGPESAQELAISQVAQVFRIYQKRGMAAPKGINDIAPLANNLPAAVESIKSGNVLVYWGVSVSDSPEAASTVLAYQKDVSQKGGEVLMQDGTARNMTAEEFNAAKKPAGATTESQKTTNRK